MSAPRRTTLPASRSTRPTRRPVGLATAAVVTTAGLVGLGLQAPAVAADGGAGRSGTAQSQGADRSGAGQARASQQRQSGAGTSKSASAGSKSKGASAGSKSKGASAGSKSQGADRSAGRNEGAGRSSSAGQPQGNAYGQNKDKGAPAAPARPAAPAQAAPSRSAGDGAASDPEAGGRDGDPAGNNGTVKIAPLGELDGIPQNTPHPGCTFQVEWYGFDEGDDIISTVSLAMQAPTADVLLDVAGDTTVPVGGDPASGAGTDTGLDGTQAYALSFDGEPHPQQGYHVKLTVSTPRSQGNDTKTKVFWVEPCQLEAAPAPALAEGSRSVTSGGTLEEGTSDLDLGTPGFVVPQGVEGIAGWVLGGMEVLSASLQSAGIPGLDRAAGTPTTESTGVGVTDLGLAGEVAGAEVGAGEVAGAEVVAGEVAGAEVVADTSAAPSAVDAGLGEAQRATLAALVAALLGSAVAFGALVARRRSVRS